MHLSLGTRLLLLGVLGLSVLSCKSTEDLLSVRGSGPRLFGSVLNADVTARQPDADTNYGIQRVSADGSFAPIAPQVYPGSGDSAGGGVGGPFVPADGNSAGGEKFRLNFENAQLEDVVRSILNDALKVNYIIDPQVTGRATLSSARPVSSDELLPILEALLRINQAALLKDGDIYRIVFDTDAGNLKVNPVNAGGSSGYGITALPLRYVSAETMMGLIDGFATTPESIRVNSNRNMLLIVGGSAERKTAVETALNFDTDWMADQSVAIFPMVNVRPETVIPELERIFQVEQGQAGANLIQFVPMARLKAVMAVSSRPDLIRRAGSWVSRLDQQSPAAETSVHVYRVKYRDAKLLVEILGGIFGGSVIASSQEQPGLSDQIEAGFSAFESDVSGDGDTISDNSDDSSVSDLAGGTGNTFDLASTPAASTATAGVDLFGSGGGGGQGGPRFGADTANNSIVIYADGETYLKILNALRQIDVPPLQVAINVVIAEIRLNDELRYGIQYFVKSGSVGLKDDVGSVQLFNTVSTTLARELPGFNFLIGSNESPDVIISAFDQITDVAVLSSPSMVVMENQTASLQVGEEVPVTTRQSQSTISPDAPVVNQVEFRDIGVILNVTPRIAENGIISMNIQQEISNIASGEATLTPTFAKRRFSSSVSVASGQTVLLGGLIGERSTNDDTGIPVLHRLKGIGDLFGTTTKTADRTELIVLIRPTVIRQSQDAQQVAEDLRARMWNMQQFKGVR